MRRGAVLLVFGVCLAAVGVASARAGGVGTATTTGTTTTTTSSGTTTGMTTPSYAPLSPSSLPAGCVGAGAAAIVPPSHPAVALGLRISNLGPSGYPASASIIAFSSSTVSGSTCRSMKVTLTSISLFNGAVTAGSVEAENGSGTVSGLEIDGSAVSATAGAIIPLGSWGQLTLGDTAGRLRAPLMLRLFQARDSLPAGSTIAVGFAAFPRPVGKRTKEHVVSPNTGSDHTASGSTITTQEHKQTSKPPPDFPATADPFAPGGGLTDAAKDNAVVSTALRYLGVRYQWGGASPKTGFDCSGLVMYVFAKLGVSLPHFAAAQYYSPDAVYVSPQRLQAGDLVFFTGSDGTREEPGHVGIYVGDGYLIDAPLTGSFVRFDKLTELKLANEFVGAKRIVSRLVVARHLSDTSTPGASAMGVPLGFPVMTDGPLSASPAILAVDQAAERTASRAHWIWVGVVLGGLLIALSAAGFLSRRRQRPPAPNPNSEF